MVKWRSGRGSAFVSPGIFQGGGGFIALEMELFRSRHLNWFRGKPSSSCSLRTAGPGHKTPPMALVRIPGDQIRLPCTSQLYPLARPPQRFHAQSRRHGFFLSDGCLVVSTWDAEGRLHRGWRTTATPNGCLTKNRQWAGRTPGAESGGGHHLCAAKQELTQAHRPRWGRADRRILYRFQRLESFRQLP